MERDQRARHVRAPADLSITTPFNVQVLGDGRIYVAWAENSFEIDEPTEEIPGAGFGRIVAYDRDGNMLQDFAGHELLNAPWGMVIAPEEFGAFGGDLLVANFGDGTIVAFDLETGDQKGYLRDADGEIISIDGIWGLTFGNGWSLGDANSLYFTAGPNEERDGILGRLTVAAAVPEPESWALMLAGIGLIAGFARRRGATLALSQAPAHPLIETAPAAALRSCRAPQRCLVGHAGFRHGQDAPPFGAAAFTAEAALTLPESRFAEYIASRLPPDPAHDLQHVRRVVE